ncbi:MAG: DUF6057 family protein [Planctomycetota bacterium]
MPEAKISDSPKPTERKFSSWVELLPGRSVIFFVLFGLYVWRFIDPRVFYHSFGAGLAYPAFAADAAFLRQHLTYPGGPVEYVSALLAQSYYYSWLGAAAITLLAILLWGATRILIGFAGEGRGKFLAYVPVFLLLAHCNAGDHVLTTTVALCAAVWFAVLCGKLPLRNDVPRVIFLGLISILSYWIAGAASLVFVFCASLHECFIWRRPISGALVLAVGSVVPWLLGAYVFDLVMADAYLRMWPIHYRMMKWTMFPYLAMSMYISVPAAVALVTLWRGVVVKFLLRAAAGPTEERQPRWGRLLLRYWDSGRLRWAVPTAALVVAASVTIAISSRAAGVQRNRQILTFYSHNRMWPEMLERVRGIPRESYNTDFTHEVNRALYHSGRLGDEMFSFMQSPQALLLVPPELAAVPWRFKRTAEIFFELGDPNGSEWQYQEALENAGDCPEVLEKLAFINIAKGQTETARIFLNAQARDLIHGPRARELLRRLDEDPQLADDQTVRRLRAFMPEEDFVIIWTREDETLLLNLLKTNPLNRMAFEYLMAYYLLTHQLHRFAMGIELMNNFGYGQDLPTHYEEAVLIYTQGLRTKIDTHGRRIRPATIRRHKEFAEQLWRLRHDREEAERRLRPEFGRSYFFYHEFGKSGL